MNITVRWSADNPARVRFPLSEEARALIAAVRAGDARIFRLTFSDVMVRAILRGAKEQTSRRSARLGYHAGGYIAVCETWSVPFQPGNVVCYRADGTAQDSGGRPQDPPTPGPWRSPRFMPRWATRLVLRATLAPYEKRLGDFDQDDVLREGCPSPSSDPEGSASFRDVWTGINGTFDEDAVVFVHRFEVLR
jgi:hypothetical protein